MFLVLATNFERFAAAAVATCVVMVAFSCTTDEDVRLAEARAREAHYEALAARAHQAVFISIVVAVAIVAVLSLMYLLYLRSLPRSDDSGVLITTQAAAHYASPRVFFESAFTMLFTWLLIPCALSAPLVLAIYESVDKAADPIGGYRAGLFAGAVASALVIFIRRTSSKPAAASSHLVLAVIIGASVGVGVGLALLNMDLSGPGTALKAIVSVVSLDWYFSSDPRKTTVVAGSLALITGATLPYLL